MKIVSQAIDYTCPLFTVEKRTVEHKGTTETHYVVVRNPNVTVIAVTSNNTVILIEQKRGKDNRVFTEFPSGKLDIAQPTEEQILTQAQQELLEETGYSAKNIAVYQTYNYNTNWYERTYYLCVATELTKGTQQLDGIEEIDITEVTKQELKEMLSSGNLMFPPDIRAANIATKLLTDT